MFILGTATIRLMGAIGWYVRRLSVMRPSEVFGHLRKAVFRVRDSSEYLVSSSAGEPRPIAYPSPPEKRLLSARYCESIVEEADDLISGKWVLFRDISLHVDSPPQWQKDYLSREDIFDNRPFRYLNHRTLKDADIKVVWDLNRWTQIVRIAQAAYVTEEPHYGETVTRWLEDWVEVNPPFRGWNWTSALESAIRLINFAWIEALLENRIDEALRDAIVMPHSRYTWRHRSSGSSANNHRLGELAGLIVAKCRWQNSEKGTPKIEELKALFEREILSQFSEDGGNKEQAFHYHLFSFEFIIHAYFSLLSLGIEFRPEVLERIRSTASFIVNMQSPDMRWDFGDSDDAVLVPFGDQIPTSLHTWSDWLERLPGSDGPTQWLGTEPFSVSKKGDGWYVAEQSGYAVFRDDDWFVRLDGSPLGYLSIAAHAHLDAMHASFWFRSHALIVDPGTGTYFFDSQTRQRLADETAHNGPVVGTIPMADRRGVFLWLDHHPTPTIWQGEDRDVFVQSDHHEVSRRRRIRPTEDGWVVEDVVQSTVLSPVSISWHFAPEVGVEQVNAHTFRLTCYEAVLWLRVDSSWKKVSLDASSLVSPSFRVLTTGSAINLVGESNGPRPYVTVLEKQG